MNRVLQNGVPCNVSYFDTEVVIYILASMCEEALVIAVLTPHNLVYVDKATGRVTNASLSMWDCAAKFREYQQSLKWEEQLQVKVGDDFYQKVTGNDADGLSF